MPPSFPGLRVAVKVKLPMGLLPDPVMRSPLTVALESISRDSVPMENTMVKLRASQETDPFSIWESPISPLLMLPEKEDPS